MVTRYEALSLQDIWEDDEGEYVEYEDYAKLEKESSERAYLLKKYQGGIRARNRSIKKLEQELAALNEPVQLSEWQKMEQELAALREACQALSDNEKNYVEGWFQAERKYLDAIEAALNKESDDG